VYRVDLDSRAQKDLDRLQGSNLRRMFEALQALEGNPRPAGHRKLRGADDVYRLRIGDYRAVYTIDDAAKVVKVWRVLHRKDIYRGL
jgi:mRNA interferase RelE/StbE